MGLGELEPGSGPRDPLALNPAPEAEFWNFYVSNIWWEDLDPRTHRMRVNASDARTSPTVR